MWTLLQCAFLQSGSRLEQNHFEIVYGFLLTFRSGKWLATRFQRGGPTSGMDLTLQELREECDRATREFLSVRGWPCPKYKVDDAVAEIRLGSRLAQASMSWLLDQIPKIPEAEKPALRLNDLIQALAALREYEGHAHAEKSALAR